MSKSPAEILKKTKQTDKDDDKSDKKKPTRNALTEWIGKKKHDVGKHNNGKTTGFSAVEKKADKEYGSKEAGERVAGAVFQKMKAAHKA